MKMYTTETGGGMAHPKKSLLRQSNFTFTNKNTNKRTISFLNDLYKNIGRYMKDGRSESEINLLI